MADQMIGGGQQNAIGSRDLPKAKGQGIMEESSTQKAPMGTKLEFDDGRVFRYAKASAAISSSLVVSVADTYRDPADTNDTFVAQAAGSTDFKVSARAGDTENEYAGAYFANITNGEQYRIKSNTAAATVNGVSSTVIFTLYDPLKTAIATDNDYLITPSPYASVITATAVAGSYDRPVGVSPIGVSSGYYFWLQTEGIALIKVDSNVATTRGTPVTLSDGDAGCVEDQSALASPIIGICHTQGATGSYSGVLLNLH